jgi:hypothetical protein
MFTNVHQCSSSRETCKTNPRHSGQFPPLIRRRDNPYHPISVSTLGLTILADSNMAGVLGWSLVLIVFIFVAFIGVMRLRTWLKDDDTPVSVGFSLTDLRQLHRQGKMTDAEFEKARNLMVAHAKQMAEKLPHPLAGSKAAADRARREAGLPDDTGGPNARNAPNAPSAPRSARRPSPPNPAEGR